MTRFGRDLYAVGGNDEAARLAGINDGRVIMLAYALAGFCAAVTALIMVARFTTSTEALGTGMELTAIAAAVIGGVSLAGGTGSMFGPVIGAFLLGAILLGLTLLGIGAIRAADHHRASSFSRPSAMTGCWSSAAAAAASRQSRGVD